MAEHRKVCTMKALIASTITLLTAGAAFAQSKPGSTPVPEIDALAGVAAVAVVGAAVALIRERSKR